MHALIVDDDEIARGLLGRLLREEGFEVVLAESIREVGRLLAESSFSIAFFAADSLTDGKALDLEALGIPIVMLMDEARPAGMDVRYPAQAYLRKPFTAGEARRLVRKLMRRARPAQASTATKVGGLLIGRSAVMQRLFRSLERVANSDLTVLISGEPGTGKKSIARLLHDRSQRSARPFVAINAAAMPPESLERELFGYEKGAFAEANESLPGCFERADGGTLFIDDVDMMPSEQQAKLLRVLEEGRAQRLGASEPRAVNVRLLVAAQRNISAKVARGEFREDLFYRLNVVRLHIPPLRERRDDIRELAYHLLDEAAAELDMSAPILLDDAADLLCRYDWPGNVRELKNVMWRLAVLTPGATITLSDVALALGNPESSEQPEETLSQAVTRCTRQYLLQLGYAPARDLYQHMLEQMEPPLLMLALEHCRGNQLKAAEMLGLNRNTLRKMLRKYNIDPRYFKG